MKILHVYKDYYPIFGGIENNVQQIAEQQVALGHDVSVLVTNPDTQASRETINGVNIIRAGRLATVASTPLSLTYPFLLNRHKPDIAHLHFPYPLGDVSQLLFGRAHPFVITYHSDIVKQQSILKVYGPILKRVLQRCDRVMPTSTNYIQSSAWLRPISDKCTAVPLGLDPTPFTTCTEHIAEWPPTDMPTLAFMGKHRYYKGLDTLLHAMPQINARLLVGGDGPMKAEWEALSAQLGVSDRVHFLGRLSNNDLPRLYRSADMFVLPANSRAEAFGIVLMEAMVSGLPCVTTELSTGTSFIVQHDKTGFVVPPKDPTALADAIKRLLDAPDLRQKMGVAGRERILTEFTIERMVERIQAVYEQVI